MPPDRHQSHSHGATRPGEGRATDGTVLITGVTGRIGANLARALARRDYHVIGLVRANSPSTCRSAGLDIENHSGDLFKAVRVA